MPGPDVHCILQDADGRCPPDCCACTQFLRQFDQGLERTER
jgi:hypothetical protein